MKVVISFEMFIIALVIAIPVTWLAVTVVYGPIGKGGLVELEPVSEEEKYALLVECVKRALLVSILSVVIPLVVCFILEHCKKRKRKVV